MNLYNNEKSTLSQKSENLFTIREGTFSIILSNGYYGEFIDIMENKDMNINPLFLKDYQDGYDYYPKNKDNTKLMKITYYNSSHNEELLDDLRELDNFNSYFCIPEKEKIVIYKKSLLYNFISTLKFEGKIHNIIKKQENLYYSYISNVGNLDLQFIMEKIYVKNDLSIWEENVTWKMKDFIKYMIDALDFLHTRNIVHLDIKPENIIYNELSTSKFGNRFRIIDLGFADIYPFKKCLDKPKGSQGYMPIYHYSINEQWMPTSNPNDWSVDGHISKIFYDDKRYSITKSDIYSLGRTIFYLDYLLDLNINNSVHFTYSFFCCKRKNKKKYNNDMLNLLSYRMTEEKIENRFCTKLCNRFIASSF